MSIETKPSYRAGVDIVTEHLAEILEAANPIYLEASPDEIVGRAVELGGSLEAHRPSLSLPKKYRLSFCEGASLIRPPAATSPTALLYSSGRDYRHLSHEVQLTCDTPEAQSVLMFTQGVKLGLMVGNAALILTAASETV